MKHLLAMLTLTALLAGCTGTEEPATPINLLISDDDVNTALPGDLLRAVQGGFNLPNVCPVNPGGVSVPLAQCVVERGEHVSDLATLALGRRVAVVYPQRVAVRGSDLDTDIGTLQAPTFVPCFREAAVSEDGLRLAVFSAPDEATDNLGCPAVLVPLQHVVVYTSVGVSDVNTMQRLYEVELPGPATPAEDVHVALVGDNLYVARQLFPFQSEVRVYAPDGNDVDFEPELLALYTVDFAIRDLTSLNGQVYAATDRGVREVTLRSLSETPIIAGDINKVWGRLNILAAWSDDPGAPLVLRNATGGTEEIFGLDRLRDLVFTPDGFLYALQPDRLQRFDIVGFNLGRDLTNLDRSLVEIGVRDGRSAAFTIPPTLAP